MAVVVLKAKDGSREETLCYRGVDLRHEPAFRFLVLNKNGADIGTFDDADVARWYYEPQ